ncbi:hypothetical protein PR048_032229 [Dryococelus australis]|uniref:Odorant receptor n=1 Tax=Dryococelus australis TaxID=614101 RepID=A0ABQ9G5S7_9NEOP|nr:hypothetical protein PR048_032229 [Dryococelus australis]
MDGAGNGIPPRKTRRSVASSDRKTVEMITDWLARCKGGRSESGEYLTANVKLLRFVGMWNDFPRGSHAWRAYVCLTVFVLVAFVLHLATQFAFPFAHIKDVGDATEGFNLTTVYVVTFLKMLTLLWRAGDVERLISALGRGVGCSCWREEEGILDEGSRSADRLTRAFSTLTAFGTAFFCLHAALTVAPTVAPCSARNSSSVDEHCLDADRNLVYPAEFPFDTAGDSLGHVVALVFQLVGPGLFGNAVNLAADLLLVSLLIHLRARYRALSYLLRGLDARVGEMGGEVTSDLELHHDEGLRYRLLTEYIRRHQELYRLSAAMVNIFSPLLFMQCFFSSVSYCIILFHLTMVSDDSVHLLKNALFLLTHMGQLLLFCWFGTQIYEESLSVMHAAYDTSWLRSSPRFKSSVLLIICRAQKPVLLTGFQVYLVNLETFTSVSARHWLAYL